MNFSALGATPPPALPGGIPLVGHVVPFVRNPVEFLVAAQQKMGDVFTLRVLHREFTVFCGPGASDAVFRADDETMGRRRAYDSMTPVFGKGLLFDAAPELFDQHVSFLLPALLGTAVREYVAPMEEEVDAYVSGWGNEGCVDLVEVMSELSIFIATRCLIGVGFRRRVGADLARLFEDLKSAGRLAFLISPYLPLPAFRRRDRARRELITLILQAIRSSPDSKQSVGGDPFIQKLLTSTYADGRKVPEDVAASLLLAFVVAGEHNTAAMASWTGALLLQDPARAARVLEEQAKIVGPQGRLTHRDLHGMNELYRCMMEAERLYPPTTLLLRDAEKDFHYNGYLIRRGSRIMLSPAASHRLPSIFSDPDRYDPDRFSPQRAEHEGSPSPLIAFGGGKHRCSGMAFAYQEIMIIWTVLFRTFEFELMDTPIRPDYAAVTNVPRRPCRLRYRRRVAADVSRAAPIGTCQTL